MRIPLYAGFRKAMICLLYTSNGFRPMLQFLRETITTFNKPIDFVDYEDCNPEFKENVEDDIIWLNS